MTRYKLNTTGLVLYLLFTIVEIVGLVYWLVYGNTGTGLTILVTALLIEHGIAGVQGALFPLIERKP